MSFCSEDFVGNFSSALGANGLEATNLLCENFQALADGVDTGFLLFSAYLVFSMQIGFAMLCAGFVRAKNALNILLCNVLDAAAGGISYYLFGYAFAYGTGKNANGFIGVSNFAMHDFTDYRTWIFQWSFAIACAGITSGSIAERTKFQVGHVLENRFGAAFDAQALRCICGMHGSVQPAYTFSRLNIHTRGPII